MTQQRSEAGLERRLASYTIAAGAGVLASTAGAAPTDPGINVSLTAGTADFVDQTIDIDGDGNDDFLFQVRTDYTDNSSGYCGAVELRPESTQRGVTAYNAPISAGTQIDETTDFNEYQGFLYNGCDWFTEGYGFDPGDRGFIGFRIPEADQVRGINSYRYGYMEVEVLGDLDGLTGIIHDVKIESEPDTPITVRGDFLEPRTVPVGGAVPLGLLLFAAGAAALRRRNRAQA
jgi:hypothetical protein